MAEVKNLMDLLLTLEKITVELMSCDSNSHPDEKRELLAASAMIRAVGTVKALRRFIAAYVKYLQVEGETQQATGDEGFHERLDMLERITQTLDISGIPEDYPLAAIKAKSLKDIPGAMDGRPIH